MLRIILLYDIKTYELHITATLFLAIITLFFTLFFWNNKLQILLGFVIFTLVFIFIYYLWKLVVILFKKDSDEWFWLWDVIIAPILWVWLVFFLQPNWMIEWLYLIVSYIILSSICGLFYSLLDFIIRRIITIKNRKEIEKPPFLWNTWLPFLPSMVTAVVLEIIFWNQIVYILNLFWDRVINLLFF